MRRAPATLAILLSVLVLAAIAPARAERLVTVLSTDLIEITSSFDGERLTVFGNIEPDVGIAQRHVEGPFDVIVVISGPAADRVVRQMNRRFGIWLNTEEVRFTRFPSVFHVAASAPLEQITDQATLSRHAILPVAQARAAPDSGWWRSTVFAEELVRLMGERGLFGVNERGVRFLSETAYTARLSLPSEAPPGPYIATTYVFKEGELVARRAEGFAARKTGLERFIAVSATQQPFVYGLACVALALFTGWLGGVLFRR